MSARSSLKSALGTLGRLDARAPTGATVLIYHRVGGGTGDELDLPIESFEAQLDLLVDERHDVVSIDAALDRLAAGDGRPTVVLTFDDGFADLRVNAFPHLVARRLPFILYLAAGLVGGPMAWEGSSSMSQGAPALTWEDVAELQASGLCTLANHTFTHAGPGAVDATEIDRCSDEIELRLAHRPTHFAWTWGIPVPALLPAVRERFRSAATGELGRNLPGCDPHQLARIPVRSSDPLPFFRAKLAGSLRPERTYAGVVRAAKAARQVGRRG